MLYVTLFRLKPYKIIPVSVWSQRVGVQVMEITYFNKQYILHTSFSTLSLKWSFNFLNVSLFPKKKVFQTDNNTMVQIRVNVGR